MDATAKDLAIDILSDGFVDAFVDFFYLTHRAKRGGGGGGASESTASLGGDPLTPEDVQVRYLGVVHKLNCRNGEGCPRVRQQRNTSPSPMKKCRTHRVRCTSASGSSGCVCVQRSA